MFSKASVKQPFTVLVAVIIVLVLGIVSFTKMVPDLLPSMNLPYAVVMTTYIGASPEEVEQTVTRPVEQSMASVNNIKSITSTSSENVSLVILEFEETTNMDSVTVDMRESLDMLSSAWSDSVSNPMIMKLNPDMLPVMVAALSVEGMDVQQISEYADETLIPSLESVSGVGSVTASGLIEESINVIIRQEKIDEINNKLKAGVKEELNDAKQELNDAKDDITDQKAELEDALKQFNNGMIEGSQGINSARFEILKSEIELAKGKEELESKEKELLNGLAEIEKNEKELNQTLETMISGETQLNDGLKQLNDGLSQIETQHQQLLTVKTQLEETLVQIETMMNQPPVEEVLPEESQITSAETTVEITTDNSVQLEMITQIVGALGLDPSTVTDMPSLITAVQSKLDEVNTGIATVEAKKSELATQKADLEAKLADIQSAKPQLESGLAELSNAKAQALAGKEALEQAKAQMQEGIAQINDAKEQLNDKEAELENAKNDSGKQLNDGLDAITKGEEQLNEQLDKWDDTVSDALDKADVSETITVDMISKILQAQNFSMPAGYITEDDGVKYLVKVGDKIEDIEVLQNLVLFDLKIDGLEPIKLSDVADVFKTDNSEEIYASVDGKDALILTFQKQNTFSTAEVADNLAEKFEKMSKEDSRVSFSQLMNQGDYIHLIIDSVIESLLQGAVFAIIVLLVFLKDIKATFIISCSIPISVIFTIALMYFSGISLNIISLSGLSIGVGMLVDNSIVVIENIYRLKNKGLSAVKSSVSGATQVAAAVTSSTLTTICVFAPIVFVEGLTKTLFVDMALTIAYSLTASLVVSLTVVPAMTSRLMKNSKEIKTVIFDKFRDLYVKVLHKVMKVKALVLILVVALLGASAYAVVGKGFSFMPDMDSTQISITLEMPEDSVLEDTITMSEKVMEQIRGIKEVKTVGAMLSGGMASMLGSTSDTSVTNVTMYVILNEDKTRTSQEIATEINNMFINSECIITANGSAMDMSMLGGSGVTVKVTGNELETLQDAASAVAEKISTVEGIDEVNDGMDNPSPELKITVDKEKAMLNGLTVAQVYAEIAQNISSSSTATTLSSNGNSYDIIVQNGSDEEMTRQSIRDYVFEVTEQSFGETEESETKEVKLSEIATIEDTFTLSSINRQNQGRYISVSATVKEGYNVSLVSQDIEKVFKDFKLPEGCEIEFSGENETIMEALEQLVLMLILAILFIYLIMVAQFQSLKSPFIVIFTLPLAFTGGFLALLITGNELSVISMIGFVMLSGIVVNNGIVLVDYMNQLRLDGMAKYDAIIEACSTRLRPVLMTALTTILGLMMMAIGTGMGSDMVQPLAIVTIGGLLYATFTTLFVIPVIYDIFNKKEMVKIEETEFELAED